MRSPHGRAAVKDESAAYATEAILGRRSLRMRPESEDLHGMGFATRTGTEKRPRSPAWERCVFHINLLPYAWKAANHPHEISRCGDEEGTRMQRSITRKSIRIITPW